MLTSSHPAWPMLTFGYDNDHPDDKYRSLDLYLPQSGDRQTPLLVFIHGGAWRSEDKQDHTSLANQLVERGFAVAVPNYRLSLKTTADRPPEVQHPTHILDIQQCLRFLTQTPPHPGYNPNEIFLIGHSAGAHIAMMLVLDPVFEKLSAIRGIVPADGIFDIPLLLRDYPDYADFIHQAFGDDTSKFAEASPTAKKAYPVPPVRVVHSLEDELVNLAQAEVMVEHLKKIPQARVELDTSVKGKHHEMVHGSDFVDSIVDFVKKCQTLI